MAINISFASDVRPFLKGTDSITDALDDVADALDDLDGDAKDAGKEIGSELKKGAEKAESAAEGLEKTFRSTFDTVQREADTAGDKIGKSTKDGFDKASQGADEFKDEANSTAREAAASFDGSADSIMDAFQEVSANAFAGFGPAGAIAGLGIAAGIGIGMQMLQATADEAAETKQKIIDLAGSIREAGGDLSAIDWGAQFEAFGNAIQDPKSWFEPWQKESKTNYETLSADAKNLGIDYRNLFQGMAGDSEAGRAALEEVNAEIEKAEEDLARATGGADRHTIAVQNLGSAERDRLEALNRTRDGLEEATGLTEEAIEHEKLMAEAYKGSAQELQDKNEALNETLELTAEVIGSELDYLDTLEQTTTALAENASAGFDKNTAAGRENLRGLGEIAKAALDYSDATLESTGSQQAANEKIYAGRDAAIAAAKSLGMTEDQARAYADSLGLIPREVSTKASADTASAESKLEAVARRREAYVEAVAQTEHAQIAMNRLTQKTYYTTVTPVMGTMRVV